MFRCEWSVRIVARGVAEPVGVAGGVREIVFAVVFMQPGGFEETALMIARLERLTVGGEDDEVARGLGKFQHVIAQARDFGAQGRLMGGGFMAAFDGFVVPVAL